MSSKRRGYIDLSPSLHKKDPPDMPRGTSDDTRDQILKAADRLFYRDGIARVSIDQIAERAEVTKRTIYYHFESKDALITAYLERRDTTTLEWLIGNAEAAGNDPIDQISALFDALAKWAESKAFEGCPFVRAAGDLVHEPSHPALRIGSKHKAKHLDWLIDLARRSGSAEPKLLGRQLLVLVDGAIAEALVTADPTYFDAASKAAVTLLGGKS